MELQIDRAQRRSLLVLGSLVEARDPYTGGHLWRVSQYSKRLADTIGLSGNEVFLAALGGFLHDLGKIGIPDRVLLKRGKLKPTEYEIIKTHPLIGRDALRTHPLAPLALDVVTYHHERVDGTGYPERLSQDEIPFAARIVAVADAFDAMTSRRPYRLGMPPERALAEIAAERGRQFDGEIADCFLELAETGALQHIVGHSGLGRPLAYCPVCGPVIVVPKGAAEGTIVYCKVCSGEFRLLRADAGFVVEFTGNHGGPAVIRPEPDFEAVDELEMLAAA